MPMVGFSSRLDRKWPRAFAAALAPQLAVTGCATPDRLPAVPRLAAAEAGAGPGPVRFLVARENDAFTEEAKRSFAKEQAYLAGIGHTGPQPPVSFLAISGGGDNGAFGAGLLNGWTAAGTRPEFKAVTGVSTGALIAPFAFLGSGYDAKLEEVYTTISQDDVFKMRGVLKGICGDGMADSAPLMRMVERYVDQAMLDAIAAEYARGRLLLIGTTDLDALEPVVWNMTAIAASKDP